MALTDAQKENIGKKLEDVGLNKDHVDLVASAIDAAGFNFADKGGGDPVSSGEPLGVTIKPVAGLPGMTMMYVSTPFTAAWLVDNREGRGGAIIPLPTSAAL